MIRRIFLNFKLEVGAGSLRSWWPVAMVEPLEEAANAAPAAPLKIHAPAPDDRAMVLCWASPSSPRIALRDGESPLVNCRLCCALLAAMPQYYNLLRCEGVRLALEEAAFIAHGVQIGCDPSDPEAPAEEPAT